MSGFDTNAIEVAGATLTILAAVAGFWRDTSVRLRVLEMRQDHIQKELDAGNLDKKGLGEKLDDFKDEIKDAILKLSVELGNKANRA